MRYGLTLPRQPPEGPLGPDRLRTFAALAADAGFAYLSMPDHVVGVDPAAHPGWRGAYDLDDPVREVFVLSGFLAGISALEIVPSVVVLPQRQTAVVAKQAAELDLLAEGRLRLGLGVGWNDVEYAALGTDFSTRGRRFEEQIAVLRLLWTERSVRFAGEFDTLDGVGLWPLPLQRPIPLWLSGGPYDTAAGSRGEGVLDRVGRLGDGWIARPLAEAPLVAHSVALIRRAAERAGRDPSAIGVQATVRPEDPADLPRQVEALREAGASHVTVDLPPSPFDRQLDLLHAVGRSSVASTAPIRLTSSPARKAGDSNSNSYPTKRRSR